MQSKEDILKEMGGISEDIYDAIVRTFYEEARGRMAIVIKSIESNNFIEISQAAHAIKGSASNLHLTQIQEIARNLELAAKANNTTDVIKFKDQLGALIP